ncbi:family 1 encapsulin nanocompartment shell protein [Streptomyces tendae]|uniref:family 1 encapsulin nanocompartment shell protein n=1 Tax=Streptomyces tendae TaxID=1932 RepID=UPI0033DEF5BD
MNNLHRELAPMSAAAWTDLEAEARRTFRAHIAGRRLVDVPEAGGVELAAIPTGHSDPIDPPDQAVYTRLRRSKPLVELRVPFTVSRQQVDDVERGAMDADWQPVKDAARQIAFAEDRAIFEGLPQAGIDGLRDSSSNAFAELPDDPRDYPEAVGKGVSALRLAGVEGPYTLALSAGAYEAVSETSDHGHPVRDRIARLLQGDIVWAPAVTGAFLVSTRGGDYTLRLGQDLSIGYLSHDAEEIRLYFQETLTFLVHATEATVHFTGR